MAVKVEESVVFMNLFNKIECDHFLNEGKLKFKHLKTHGEGGYSMINLDIFNHASYGIQWRP